MPTPGRGQDDGAGSGYPGSTSNSRPKIGAVGLLIDGFAERRARPYTAALEALAAERSGGPSPPG